ncbi:MAG: DUF4878 domain-containing protein [Bacteroidetes bacterium]|nr:DUF4878 domain-containing protein [Bacteroidota bacterium]
MKKLFVITLSAMFAITTLQGCRSNTPKAVAESFLNDFVHMNYDNAESIATPATKDLLHTVKQLASTKPDSVWQNAKKINVTIVDVKEDGDKAVVTFTTSAEKGEKKLNLIKQDDKWVVNLTKNDSLVSEYEKEDAEETEPVNADDSTATDTAAH